MVNRWNSSVFRVKLRSILYRRNVYRDIGNNLQWSTEIFQIKPNKLKYFLYLLNEFRKLKHTFLWSSVCPEEAVGSFCCLVERLQRNWDWSGVHSHTNLPESAGGKGLFDGFSGVLNGNEWLLTALTRLLYQTAGFFNHHYLPKNR